MTTFTTAGSVWNHDRHHDLSGLREGKIVENNSMRNGRHLFLKV